MGVRLRYSLFGKSTKGDFRSVPSGERSVAARRSQVLVPTSTTSPPRRSTSVTFNDPCSGLPQAQSPPMRIWRWLAKACRATAPSRAERPDHRVEQVNRPSNPRRAKVKTRIRVRASYVQGLSLEVDYWDITSTAITTLDSNYSIQRCVATGSPRSQPRDALWRGTGTNAEQIRAFVNPSFNLGSLKRAVSISA